MRDQARDKHAAGATWTNPDRLAFSTEAGSPLGPSDVRRALQSIDDADGIGHLHPHLLRHAAAGLLSQAGVRLEDIADTLGRRSVTVTADIYRHPLAPIRTGHLDAMTTLSGTRHLKLQPLSRRR